MRSSDGRKKKVRSLFNNIFNNVESFRFKSVDGCVGQMIRIVMRIFPFFYFFFGIRGKRSENEVETSYKDAIHRLKVVITPHDRVTLTFFQFRVAAVFSALLYSKG